MGKQETLPAPPEPWRVAETGDVVERECLLFEAGDYPDKGVRITEDDLRAIAANTDTEVPVKIEHLSESPFDAALGVVTGLRVRGAQLWGTLRQPVEAWRLAQRAGARALSVALDVAGRRLVETSFVCRPRVAAARVFAETVSTRFTTGNLFDTDGKGGAEKMTSVRLLAEGLTAYLRGFLGSGESERSDTEIGREMAEFAQERALLSEERARMREEQASRQIAEWKRKGRMRGTERAEQLARALLTGGSDSAVLFDEKSVPLSALFARFVEENGPVVLMGELLPGNRQAAMQSGTAGERLAALAKERSRTDGLTYTQSFLAVTAENPDLARAAREE